MALFEYTARATDGGVHKGTLIAQDVPDLREKLASQGLTLTTSTLGRRRSAVPFLERLQSVPAVQKMFFTQYLQVMVRSGFSISRALETLARQTTNKYFRKVILEIRSDVESGLSLSKSLAKHPRVFSELFINMVAAGESSGKLDDVLLRLSQKMKKDHALISKVKGAMTYPIIIVVVMIIIAILMAVIVIPKLTEIFTEAGGELPLATRIMIAISDFLIHNGVYVAIGVVILAVILARFARTTPGKRLFHGLILRLPIAAPIVTKISLARFTRSMSSLLETSIPIVDAFLIVSRTMGNIYYQNAIQQAAAELKTGSTIAKVLERYPKLFPPLATQMIEIGEESGSLDSIAGDLANFYEEEVDQTMSNLSTIIEPVLMLLLGVGVAGMAVSIILPIYSLSEQIT